MKSTFRKYIKSDVISFSNTKEKYGGLSNMAPGYPLFINDLIINTAEALYQACRFPDYPELQYEIITQNSPMTAKMIGRKNIDKTREDWEMIKFEVMRWVLMAKLLQNKDSFSKLLMSTDEKPIVEYSKKDKVWAASPSGDSLVGINALGRLLMDIRENIVKNVNMLNDLERLEPLKVNNFKLCGYDITTVYSSNIILDSLTYETEGLELV